MTTCDLGISEEEYLRISPNVPFGFKCLLTCALFTGPKPCGLHSTISTALSFLIPRLARRRDSPFPATSLESIAYHSSAELPWSPSRPSTLRQISSPISLVHQFNDNGKLTKSLP